MSRFLAIAAGFLICCTMLAQENRLRNGSFEGSLKYWLEGGALDASTAAEGRYSLRLAPGDRVRSASYRLEPGKTVRISCWAKASRPRSFTLTPCPANRGVAQGTKSVWTKDPAFAVRGEANTEWQRFTWEVEIPTIEDTGSFLGGEKAWWNRTSWVMWISAPDKQTTLWIDGLSLTYGEDRGAYAAFAPIELCADAPALTRERYTVDANFLWPDRPLEVTAAVHNPTDTAQDIRLRWEVLDYLAERRFGEPLEEALSLPAGDTRVLTRAMPLEGRGLMLARVSVLNSVGEVLVSSDQPATVLAFPKSATVPNPEERFGGSLRGGPLMKASQEIGLGWTRWYVQMEWNKVQPTGPDEWKWPDDQVRRAQSHGLSVTATLYDPPKWALNGSARAPADWATYERFVTEAVKRYGHEGIVYEVSNEPDIRSNPRWAAAEYLELVKRTYQAVKAVDPEARVQVNATWPGVSAWTLELWKAGGHQYFDDHTFHNYTPSLLSGPFITNSRKTLEQLGATPKGFWFNEGWTYVPTSQDYPAPPIIDKRAPDVAHVIVQSATTLLADGCDKFITFHIGYGKHGKSWWDWVGSGTEWWDDLNEPTIAVSVYNVLADQLGLSDPVKTIRPTDAVLHVFQDNRHQRGVVVAWANVNMTLDLPLADLTSLDVTGNATDLDAVDGVTQVALVAGRPCYLYSRRALSGEVLAEALEPLQPIDDLAGYRLPDEWRGEEVDGDAGSVLLRNGKPFWSLAQVWPDDPTLKANYVPLVWSATSWVAKEHSHGGQPNVSVRPNQVAMSSRTHWPNEPGNKIPALLFQAPDAGTYDISGSVSFRTWEGTPMVYMTLYRFALDGDGAEAVAELTLEGKTGEVQLQNLRIELAAGQTLAFLPTYKLGRSATNLFLKTLTLTPIVATEPQPNAGEQVP